MAAEEIDTPNGDSGPQRVAGLFSRANLAKAKNGTMAVGVITAALAGLAGTILATPAKTSRGRTRS